MAGGCGVGAFCSFCGKCGRVFNTLFDAGDVPVVLPPGMSAQDVDQPSEGEVLGGETVRERDLSVEFRPAFEAELPSN